MIKISDMKPMSEFPNKDGHYLVYIPTDIKPYQVMYWNSNVIIIGHYFHFDVGTPTVHKFIY